MFDIFQDNIIATIFIFMFFNFSSAKIGIRVLGVNFPILNFDASVIKSIILLSSSK